MLETRLRLIRTKLDRLKAIDRRQEIFGAGGRCGHPKKASSGFDWYERWLDASLQSKA